MVVNTGVMVVNTDVLNSWKEVATYLGRGIRTVQRWERELGLPIRRPRGKPRGPVIAFRRELDQWLQSAPTAEPQMAEHQLTEPQPDQERSPKPDMPKAA
jgi:phage terminase Nu1 subunit (DNA packaging protein)